MAVPWLRVPGQYQGSLNVHGASSHSGNTNARLVLSKDTLAHISLPPWMARPEIAESTLRLPGRKSAGAHTDEDIFLRAEADIRALSCDCA